MSKQCPGKYHGKGIKYISDDEKYCRKCRQEITLKKKRRNEVIGGVLTTTGSILAFVFRKSIKAAVCSIFHIKPKN